MLPATYLPRWLIPSLGRRDPPPPLAAPVIISWAGMRGVVSLAAALALPEQFAGRDFILAATFAVILVTVLVQGATLAPLIRALRIGAFVPVTTPQLPEADARARIAAAQLAAIEARSAMPDGSQRHPRLLEQFSYRSRVAANFALAGERLIEDRNEHFTAILAAVGAGRAELLRLHRTGAIHDAVLHALEEELDLDEIRARQVIAGPGGDSARRGQCDPAS